jgi:sulfate permease, SulP family
MAYTEAALMLALISGLMMLLMGALRLGFLAHFLSQPVISGFVSASGILIAVSQLKHLLDVPLKGDALPQLVPNLIQQLPHVHIPTVLMGAGVLGFLVLARNQLKSALMRWG